MRANISDGLYIFYPIFENHFFVFKEAFSENSVLICMVSIQERVMMARILKYGSELIVSFSISAPPGVVCAPCSDEHVCLQAVFLLYFSDLVRLVQSKG